jgi:hypothetical protein
MAKQFLYALLSALIAVAQTALTATRMVWKGGKWIAESFRLPERQAPAAAASAANAMAALAEVTETPAGIAAAPAPQRDVTPDEAAREWGDLAKAYANAMASPTAPEPDLRALDEAARGWLYLLSVPELMKIANADPVRVGRHMLGQGDVPGLSICPTQREYEEAMLLKAEATNSKRLRIAEGRMAAQAALQDLVDNPSWEPRHA